MSERRIAVALPRDLPFTPGLWGWLQARWYDVRVWLVFHLYAITLMERLEEAPNQCRWDTDRAQVYCTATVLGVQFDRICVTFRTHRVCAYGPHVVFGPVGDRLMADGRGYVLFEGREAKDMAMTAAELYAASEPSKSIHLSNWFYSKGTQPLLSGQGRHLFTLRAPRNAAAPVAFASFYVIGDNPSVRTFAAYITGGPWATPQEHAHYPVERLGLPGSWTTLRVRMSLLEREYLPAPAVPA